MISWDLLTVGDLLRFQKEFEEKGIVRIMDGDKKAAITLIL